MQDQHLAAYEDDERAPRPEGLSDALTPEQLRAYIAEAQKHRPFIPESLTCELCSCIDCKHDVAACAAVPQLLLLVRQTTHE